MHGGYGSGEINSSLIIKRYPPEVTVNHALALCIDFWEAKSRSHNPLSIGLQWHPPELGSWKLNVDGAIFPNHHRSGAGFILRDDCGKVVVAGSHPEVFLPKPMEVELLAIFRGMQFGYPLGIPKLTIEIDCLLAVQALEEGVDSVATHRHLISEILSLKQCFVSCSFSYVSRIGNQAAHSLTRYAWQVTNTMVWRDAYPDFVLSALWIDSIVKHVVLLEV